MKLTIKELRSLIKNHITESALMQPPAGGYVKVDGNLNHIKITIVDPSKRETHWPGFMSIGRVQLQDGVVREVENVSAEKGYGPLLYDVAMELVGPGDYMGDNGIMCDRTSVSAAARNVWKHYFENRTDVEKEKLPENWFIFSATLKERPEYLKYYYFKFDTSTIDSLKSNGLIKSDDFDFFEKS